MMAIWPAGPPKLMKPSFTQNQKASQKPTALGCVSTGCEVSVCIFTFFTLWLNNSRQCNRGYRQSSSLREERFSLSLSMLLVRVGGQPVVAVGGHAMMLFARLLRRVDMHHGRLQVVQLVQQAVVDLAGYRVTL
jgi:hypothetical protein